MKISSFLHTLLWVVGFFPIGVYAQTSIVGQEKGNNLPEALKNIPAASGVCRKEDFVAKPAEIKRAPRIADPSCAISLDQLSGSLAKPETMLIDVRDKSVFDMSHIDGAINFNESEIRTKAYLKDKSIVLIGDGKGDQELYELCSELKGYGFKHTRVLKGGIMAWALDNKPMIGTLPAMSNLIALSSVELFQETKAPNNVVISVAGGSKLSDVIQMDGKLTGADLNKSVADLVRKRKKLSPLSNIIIVADERFKAEQFLELAKMTKPTPVFIYHDTEQAYRQFLKVQNALWIKQAKGPARPKCGV